VKRIPGRVHLVASKRVSGNFSLRNNRPVELLDGNSLWGEHCALIGCPEGKDRRALLVQPDRHSTRSGILRNALEVKETAATHDRSLDLLISIPKIHTAMCINDPGE